MNVKSTSILLRKFIFRCNVFSCLQCEKISQLNCNFWKEKKRLKHTLFTISQLICFRGFFILHCAYLRFDEAYKVRDVLVWNIQAEFSLISYSLWYSIKVQLSSHGITVILYLCFEIRSCEANKPFKLKFIGSDSHRPLCKLLTYLGSG